MLGVAGSFSILLPEPPASSSHRTLPARMRGKLRRYGLLAGRVANLHIFHHHFLPAHRQTSSSAVDQGLI